MLVDNIVIASVLISHDDGVAKEDDDSMCVRERVRVRARARARSGADACACVCAWLIEFM